MTEKRFCPNCGKPINSNATFCKNCGYDLTKFNHLDETIPSGETRQNYNRGERDFSNDNLKTRNRSGSNKGLIITIVVLVVLLTGILGAFGYKQLFANKRSQAQKTEKIIEKTKGTSSSNSSSTTTNNNDNNNNSTEDISSDDANNVIEDVFDNMADSVENDDANDYSDDFIGGSSNDSYKQLASWDNDQSNVDNLNSVSCTVQNLSVQGTTAHFNVKYDFDHSNSDSDHIQVFPWTAKLREDSDGNVKIVSCTSSNKTIADYDE